MYNLHLLQTNLDVDEYEALGDRVLHAKTYYAALPTYVIAECPFCHEKNTEKLDTYSLRHWPGINAWGGKSVWGDNAIVHHCKHFALVQPFVNFNGLEPLEACNEFGPEVPHVIGYLLEDHCEAVIHALPLCRTEEGQFVPRYTLFIVSYFSKKYSPEEVRAKIYRFNSPFWEEPYTQLFSEPPDGREIWWNLPYWVSQRKLYWLDTQSLSLELRTGDGETFPYQGIHGRIWTYFESYPLPTKKVEIILPRFDGTKPLIRRFKREDMYDEYGAFFGLELSIEWENSEGLGFTMSNYPVAYYCLPPSNFFGEGCPVSILAREIRKFSLRKDKATGLVEVVLEVAYPPGERTLGLTDNEVEATRWVNEANKLIKRIPKF